MDRSVSLGFVISDMHKGQYSHSASSDSPSRKCPFFAADHAADGKFHLLLAASGSVATIKIPSIVQGLSPSPETPKRDLSIRIVLTKSAAQFLRGQSPEQPSLDALATYPQVDAIYLDEDEWKIPWTRNASILHIELRRWADCMVIAPLSANTLAKIANGVCDNLLTSVVRAWPVESLQSFEGSRGMSQPNTVYQRKIVVAPAMNTAMWRHPLTGSHLAPMRSGGAFHWFLVLEPTQKELACGDTGDGAMKDSKDVVREIENHSNRGIVRHLSSYA